MNKKRGLRIGEFARVCRTTKETLLHYERKGVLCPKYVAENGYREYGMEQYMDFCLVSLLAQAGGTLGEIKNRREAGGRNGYLDFLKDRMAFLQSEQRLLARRLALLSRLVAMAEEAASSDFDALFFEERKQETIRLYPVGSRQVMDSETAMAHYAAFLLESLAEEDWADLPLGTIIPESEVAKGNFKMAYFFFAADKKAKGDQREIPAGRYACFFHRGHIGSHESAFQLMLKAIAKAGLSVLGDMYVCDKVSYVLQDTNPDYVAKYMIRVG